MNNKLTPLNKLMANWPTGTVYTLAALKKTGHYMQLMERYKKGKWIESVGFGAYKRFSDQIEWYGGVYALQTQLSYNIHPGGKTSLELQGYAHYLSENMKQCVLFGERGQKIPEWFKKYNWGINIIYKPTQLFPPNFATGITDFAHKEFSIKISTPERAIIEMLYLVPNINGFDESYRLMENLTTLRPNILQELLEQCRSIKTRRMFMYMAERADQVWLKKLSTGKINLGSGKRVIIRNGVLDKKYNITVPKDFD